jgi:hypothetical protein
MSVRSRLGVAAAVLLTGAVTVGVSALPTSDYAGAPAKAAVVPVAPASATPAPGSPQTAPTSH